MTDDMFPVIVPILRSEPTKFIYISGLHYMLQPYLISDGEKTSLTFKMIVK